MGINLALTVVFTMYSRFWSGIMFQFSFFSRYVFTSGLLFLCWPFSCSVTCCLISTYLWFFQFSSCNWFLISYWLWLEKMLDLLVLTRPCLCLCYPSGCDFFLYIFSCERAFLLVFRLFSERVVLYVHVVLVFSWAEVSSGSFYYTILILTFQF